MKKIILFTIALLLVSSIFSTKAEAQLAKPFGGLSTFVVLCTCDGSYLITIPNSANLLAPEQFLYSPYTTLLYGNYLFMKVGAYMLGTAEYIMTACMMTSSSGCTPAGMGYPIRIMGTSL